MNEIAIQPSQNPSVVKSKAPQFCLDYGLGFCVFPFYYIAFVIVLNKGWQNNIFINIAMI